MTGGLSEIPNQGKEMTMQDHEFPAEKAARYGVAVHDTHTVGETNALRESIDHSRRPVEWTDPELARVLRFRLIGANREYPFWDVSYVYGEMRDGSRVRVHVPFRRLPRFGWQRALVQEAIRDGVHAKNLGMLDPNVYSTLAG